MVISAEPPPPPPPDPAADAAVAAAVEVASAAATSNPRLAAFSSFPSLKTWGSHRVMRCAHVNRAGGAIAAATTARRSPEKLGEVREELLCHLREAFRADAAADADAAAEAEPEPEPEPEPAAARPWKLRTRRRRAATPSASASPPPERRPSRARGEPLDRPRFSLTLSSEEIEEDIYAVTGARARRRPRRRPRTVQKQLDVLFPGSWLSEITTECYRVPDDR